MDYEQRNFKNQCDSVGCWTLATIALVLVWIAFSIYEAVRDMIVINQ